MPGASLIAPPIRFLIAGGAATLLQLGLLMLFVELELLAPVISSALSYSISAVFNYLLNYYLTFASTKAHVETFPKFLMVAGVGVVCNTATFAALLYLGCNYFIAQCLAIVVTLLLNFTLHKYWIYRE